MYTNITTKEKESQTKQYSTFHARTSLDNCVRASIHRHMSYIHRDVSLCIGVSVSGHFNRPGLPTATLFEQIVDQVDGLRCQQTSAYQGYLQGAYLVVSFLEQTQTDPINARIISCSTPRASCCTRGTHTTACRAAGPAYNEGTLRSGVVSSSERCCPRKGYPSNLKTGWARWCSTANSCCTDDLSFAPTAAAAANCLRC